MRQKSGQRLGSEDRAGKESEVHGKQVLSE